MESVANAGHAHLGEIDDRRQNPDRRRAARRKLLKAGRTIWPNGDSSECVICNLSATGAQLELRGPAPNRFDLAIEGDPWRRACLVVWRKRNRIGVKFPNPLDVGPSPRKPITRIADFKRHVEECRMLAERAVPSDRDLLLEMAEAWILAIRRLRTKARLSSE